MSHPTASPPPRREARHPAVAGSVTADPVTAESVPGVRAGALDIDLEPLRGCRRLARHRVAPHRSDDRQHPDPGLVTTVRHGSR